MTGESRLGLECDQPKENLGFAQPPEPDVTWEKLGRGKAMLSRILRRERMNGWVQQSMSWARGGGGGHCPASEVAE
jgi:hypothetical protein